MNATTESEVADRFYAATTPGKDQPISPSTPADSDSKAIEDRVYPTQETPAGNPYSLGSNSLEDRLYGATDKIDLGDIDLAAFTPPQDPAYSTLATNLGYMAAECGASQENVRTLVDAARLFAVPVNDDVKDLQRTQTLGDLRKVYGADLESRLAEARVLVHSFPELHDWLHQSGAGNCPTIVGEFIRLASSERGASRVNRFLKTP